MVIDLNRLRLIEKVRIAEIKAIDADTSQRERDKYNEGKGYVFFHNLEPTCRAGDELI